MVRIAALLLSSVLTCVASDRIATLTVAPFPTDHKLKLRDALALIGLMIQDGYVSFGVDVRGPEPEVEISITEPTKLETVLNLVVSQAQGYTLAEVSDHVVDVYPAALESEPDDIMNLQVAEFHVHAEPAANIFGRPRLFVPELKQLEEPGVSWGYFGPGISSAGPGVSLDLYHVSLKEILNAVAEADAVLPEHVKSGVPLGWTHELKTDSTRKKNHTWSFLSSVPDGWERFLTRKGQ